MEKFLSNFRSTRGIRTGVTGAGEGLIVIDPKHHVLPVYKDIVKKAEKQGFALKEEKLKLKYAFSAYNLEGEKLFSGFFIRLAPYKTVGSFIVHEPAKREGNVLKVKKFFENLL